MQKLLAITPIFFLLIGCLDRNNVPTVSTTTFPTSWENLPVAGTPETISARNGDTVTITASLVSKTLRNQPARMMAYNGSIPGPFIKVRQGSTIYLRLINSIDIPTTFHSHGVRLDNAYDGVPGLTQPEIIPGSSFVYTINFPDPGIYWYHPHIREDYTQELGLYGNFIVIPTDSTYWSPVNREVPLIFDDIFVRLDSIPAFKIDTINYVLMGRYGTVMMINGNTQFSLDVNKGEVIRFLMTNVASARPFRISIPGVKMKLVGTDIGTIAHEKFVDSVIIAPAERAIVDCFFGDTGLFLISNTGPNPAVKMGSIRVLGNQLNNSYVEQFNILRNNESLIAKFDSLRHYVDLPPAKRLVLSVEMDGMNEGDTMMHADSAGIEWENEMVIMNLLSNSSNTRWKIIEPLTGHINDQIHWTFKKNDYTKIRIINDPRSAHPMQHPIHFHGQRFLVIAENGGVPSNYGWKDTHMIAAGDSVDILLETNNVGRWMAHCHIAEHLAVNMMFYYDVTTTGDTLPPITLGR